MASPAPIVWTPQTTTLGSENCILKATSRRHCVHDFPGPLSVKTVGEGRVAWRTGCIETWVDPGSMLVLHDGEPYSMEIDAIEPVSTFCVFFARGFVEQVKAGLCQSDYLALDQPETARASVSFVSRLHQKPAGLSAVLCKIQHLVTHFGSTISLDEAYLSLAVELLQLHRETVSQMSRIAAARDTTRRELYRRVAQGREFLHAYAHRQPTLAQAAHAACLSPYHFHRTFTEAFGVTPAQYAAALRMDHAKRLLVAGWTVTEACYESGFRSLGSFSTAFHRRYGTPPSRSFLG